jgi:hypothetical protein
MFRTVKWTEHGLFSACYYRFVAIVCVVSGFVITYNEPTTYLIMAKFSLVCHYAKWWMDLVTILRSGRLRATTAGDHYYLYFRLGQTPFKMLGGSAINFRTLRLLGTDCRMVDCNWTTSCDTKDDGEPQMTPVSWLAWV